MKDKRLTKGLLTALLPSLLIATSALTLTGCASLTKPSKPPLAKTLTSPAPALTPLAGGDSDSLLRKFIEVSGQYYELADRHQALSDACK